MKVMLGPQTQSSRVMLAPILTALRFGEKKCIYVFRSQILAHKIFFQVGEVDPPPGPGTFPDFKLSCVVGEVTVIPNQMTT